jgi:hypothetical protein
MKGDNGTLKQALKICLLFFGLGFGSSLAPAWHEHSISAAQIGISVVVGLVMIPIDILLAVLLAMLMGLKSPSTQDVKSEIPTGSPERPHDKSQK